jgi:tetratricopeptide (TPR) repeat protein
MGSCQQLDAPRRSGITWVCALLGWLVALILPATAQESSSEQARLAAARAALDDKQWEDAARLASGPPNQSADLDFIAGLALARLERWTDARTAFEAGRRKAPKNPLFLVELAGVAYKQKRLGNAKSYLHQALRLNPQDAYSREFLGTIYFLEGNLEAALKYWNGVEKPRLRAVSFSPEPVLQDKLLSRAVAFNAPQILNRDALLATQARLGNLGVFPQQRIELAPANAEDYDATIHLNERNGWGDSKLEGLLSVFSGLPYATVYPEYYNLGHAAVNFTSLARWDKEKRRYSGSLSTSLYHDPGLRLQFYFDSRNENWNLSQTFSTTGTPLTDLNLRRTAGGVEFRPVVNGLWSWSAGIEVAHRSFRNVAAAHSSLTEKPFFTDSASLDSWMGVERALLLLPEHRLTLNGSAEARAGRNFASALGPFVAVGSSLRARWLPQATGDDFEMQAQLRAGVTAGKVPLDELFQLGIERDNDLWLRAHAGTTGGRKGTAPLGRRYLLANWEMDKNVYRAGFFTLKLGPFIDGGAIADSSGLLGSRRWLADAGFQCKMRVLSGLTVVVSYGRDLRGARDVIYGTVLH